MKRCPFCLKNYEELTTEHVFPESWYPDNLLNIEKWKVPSCKNCNSRYGKLEQEILLWATLCLDPKLPSTNTISQRVLRSFNPKLGRDERDRNARLKKVKEVFEKSFSALGSNKKIFPGFGYHEGFPIEIQRGIEAPKGLPEISEKFIRGIEYKLNNRFIDNDYSIKAYFCYENSIRDVIALIRRGENYKVAPTIEFYRAASPEGSVLLEIRIWDKLIIYGSVWKLNFWGKIAMKLKLLKS